MGNLKTLLAGVCMFSCICVSAQTGKFLGEMRGMNHKQKGYGYQGMDVWKDYVVSCQNQGVATVYALGEDAFETLGQFKLASTHPDNHANVASFGTEKVHKGDPLPVIYVSQAHRVPVNGYKDILYVERISPDFSSSELVQSIYYDDTGKDFGYALQWVVDRKHGYLYGYGNTINNTDPANRHRIIKFRLPRLSDGEFITLRPEDALENYTVEEVSGFSYNPIGQGLDIRGTKLYMPTGLGYSEYPSILYVWDLRKHTMEVVDLSTATKGELEDVSVLGRGKLLLQSQDGLFVVEL